MSEIYIHRTDKDAESGNNFTRIDNRVIGNTHLTPLARLALVYLLSKPDDWKVSDANLRRYLECGVTKLQSVIKELKTAGYLDRRQLKDNGKWKTAPTHIYESPELNYRYSFSEHQNVNDGNGLSDSERQNLNSFNNDGLSNNPKLTNEEGTTEREISASACITHDDTSSSFSEKLAQKLLDIGAVKSLKTATRDADSLLKKYSFAAIEAAIVIAVEKQQATTKYIRGILENKAAAALDNSPVGIFRRETQIKGDIKPAILEWLEKEAKYSHYTPEFLAAVIRYVDSGAFDGLSIFDVNDFENTSWELRTPERVWYRYTAADKSRFIVTDIERKAGDKIAFEKESTIQQVQAIHKVVKQIKQEFGIDAECENQY